MFGIFRGLIEVKTERGVRSWQSIGGRWMKDGWMLWRTFVYRHGSCLFWQYSTPPTHCTPPPPPPSPSPLNNLNSLKTPSITQLCVGCPELHKQSQVVKFKLSIVIYQTGLEGWIAASGGGLWVFKQTLTDEWQLWTEIIIWHTRAFLWIEDDNWSESICSGIMQELHWGIKSLF